jgi:hypothetical protein
MTPPTLRSTLETLGWSMHQLAAMLGRPVGTVKNWTRPGYRVPPDVDAWLGAWTTTTARCGMIRRPENKCR